MEEARSSGEGVAVFVLDASARGIIIGVSYHRATGAKGMIIGVSYHRASIQA